MPESPLLVSSVVPACGFCLKVQSRSRGVKESRSWEANRRSHLSGCSLGRRWAIPGLPDSSISRPGNLASEPGGTTPKKHKNNTIEASMLLKTHCSFGKRTENELKNKPNLGCLRREPNSEVARLDGKKPLTRLATLATLSPGKRALKRFGRVPRSKQCEKIQNSGEQSENVYENKGQGQNVDELRSCGANSRDQANGHRRFVTPRPSTLDFST